MSSIQDDKSKLVSAYIRSVAVIFMLMLPISGVLVILAPECVLILLGNKWLAVVTPVQILFVVLVFRTAYKISDTLARATGAVYRRAWRQWVFAISVFTGAGIGQMWGLSSVAVGVDLAIVLNFLLMFQLCSNLIRVTWYDLSKIFFRYLSISIIINSLVFGIVTILREQDINMIYTLICGIFVFFVSSLCIWHFFFRFFGEEGVWLKSVIKQNF
jgi:PST family polysaccharide transporter